MSTSMLRNFYYINTVAVDNYVSAMDGVAVTEEEQTRKEKSDKGVSLQVGLGPIGAAGGIKGAVENEVTRRVVQTYSAKIQKVYSYLEENGLEFYDSIDAEQWKSIKRNLFVEVDVEMRFSKIETIMSSMKNVFPLFENFQTTERSPAISADTAKAIAMFAAFSEADKRSGIPVELTFHDGGEYKLVSYLDQNNFLVDMTSIPKEVTLLGKIHRVFRADEKIELINLIPLLEKFSINREMRRTLKESLKSFPEEFRDTVKGPGAIITPIALYN